MELYQLRTFLTVADEAHLTRAAERLFTSQPAVSAQIRALEDELGVRLFERAPKGMLLTEAGAALRDQARRIVDAARDFKQQAEGLRGAVSGELILGLNNRPEILRLVPILRLLTTAHPELRYEMVCASSGVILQGLDEGTISIGFFEGACTNAKIAVHFLHEIELCIVAPRSWAPELSVPDWKLLESKPWIFVSPMCSYFRTIEHICQQQGLRLKSRFRVSGDLTVLNLVGDELGITIASRAWVEMFPGKERLFILPHFRTSVPLCLGYLHSRERDPAICAARDAVLTVWQKEHRQAAAQSLPRPTIDFLFDPEPPMSGNRSRLEYKKASRGRRL